MKVFPEALLKNIPLTPSAAAERMEGFAIFGVSFASCHTLALRSFPSSSLGRGFDAVWMREPNGDWRIFSTVAPDVSCAKYMLPEVADVTPIELLWIEENLLEVSIPAIGLRWCTEFEATPLTRMMTAGISRLPDGVVRSAVGSAVISKVASTFLRTGRVKLRGRVPNGQQFNGRPRAVWKVHHTHANIGTYDLGPVVRPRTQHALADFWIPARPIGMAGFVTFEPLTEPALSGLAHAA